MTGDLPTCAARIRRVAAFLHKLRLHSMAFELECVAVLVARYEARLDEIARDGQDDAMAVATAPNVVPFAGARRRVELREGVL